MNGWIFSGMAQRLTGTGAGATASLTESPNATLATGSVTSANAALSEAPGAVLAAATGAALGPAVTFGSSAVLATGTGAAAGASASFQVGAVTAAGAGAAFVASVVTASSDVTAYAVLATATGAAFNATPAKALSQQPVVDDGVGFTIPRPSLAEMMAVQTATLARQDAERDAAIAAIRSSMAPYRDDPEELWLLGLITDQEWIAA